MIAIGTCLYEDMEEILVDTNTTKQGVEEDLNARGIGAIDAIQASFAKLWSPSPAMAASLAGRWADLDRLLLRQGNLVGPGFEPGPEVHHLPSFPSTNLSAPCRSISIMQLYFSTFSFLRRCTLITSRFE